MKTPAWQFMHQSGWKPAHCSARTDATIKQFEAASMFSMLVVGDSGKGREITVA